MDRKVIVLSPSEWENKQTLGHSLDQAYNQLHFAVTRESTINSCVHGLKRKVAKGEEITQDDLDRVLEYSRDIVTHIRQSQSIVGGVATVINHKIKEGE